MSSFNQSRCSVAIHGGAGKFSEDFTPLKLPYLSKALAAAWDCLLDGQSALDAVEAALRLMEGCQYFNAGFGGYPNEHGIVLCDVGLMNGDLKFSSIMNMRRVYYPSSVARDIMLDCPNLMTVWTHEFMKGLDESDDALKERYGWVRSHEELVAPHVLRVIKEGKGAEVSSHSTVGCVVRDGNGRVAAGTSTGGSHGKYNGRIGDTPIVGCGVYADDKLGALSTTGHGESFVRSLLSGFVVARVRSQLALDPEKFPQDPGLLKRILTEELGEMQNKTGGTGAIIYMPPEGEPAFGFSSEMVSTGSRFFNKDGKIVESVGISLSNGDYLSA